jgi:hypothetical protein
LNKLISAIKALIAPLCPIITAISIVMIVAKVITLIPSFGGGLGAVVVATMPGNIAQAIYTFAVDILKKITPVPFALISVLTMIIAIYQYIEMIYNRLVASVQRQQDLLSEMTAALLRTADDWLNIDYASKAAADAILAREGAKLKQMDKFASDMIQLGADFKNAVSDIAVRLGLQVQINNIENQLNIKEFPGTPIDNDGDGIPDYVTDSYSDGDDGDYVPLTPPPPPVSILPPPPEPKENCPLTSFPDDALWERYPEDYIDECGDIWKCEENPNPEIPCNWVATGENVSDIPEEPVEPVCDEAGNCWEWNTEDENWDLISTPPLPPDTPFIGDGDLVNLRLGLLDELDKIGGPVKQDELTTLSQQDRLAVQGLFKKLDNTIITSLLYPHQDVTIKKATQRKGKRYGFYQSDINE